MEVIDLSHSGAPIPADCVTALGLFDGVHRGHLTLLRRTVSLARARGCTPAVFTFTPASDAYKSSLRLTTPEERLALLAAAGIEVVFYADFSAVKDLSPATFVSEVLIGSCHTRTAVCGYNFRFGKDAVGTPATLKTLMHASGARISVLPPKTLTDGTVISSSRIRALIRGGDMAGARTMLGRPYTLTAPILHGKALGRTLGIPTINQRFPQGAVIPAHGVYDVICEADGALYRGLANVGSRPTVDGEDINCETHIIDFDGDLYGKLVTIYFGRMLRPEERFGSVAELQAAVFQNIKEIREHYGKRMDKINRPR